jgi:hypothetical protein
VASASKPAVAHRGAASAWEADPFGPLNR